MSSHFYLRILMALSLVLMLTNCAQVNGKPQFVEPFGGAVVTDQSQYTPIDPSRVKLYYKTYPRPAHYKVVGFVAAENENFFGWSRNRLSVQAELRRQAASVGANGVININQGQTETTGDAIIVP